MLWRYIYTQSHARSACASARAREERQFPTNRTRVSFARVLERVDRQKNNLSQNPARAPKRVSASAHVGSARDPCFEIEGSSVPTTHTVSVRPKGAASPTKIY